MKDSKVMKMLYEEKWGDIIVKKVALFDERDYLTDEEVRIAIEKGPECSNSLIVLDQATFENVFRSMIH